MEISVREARRQSPPRLQYVVTKMRAQNEITPWPQPSVVPLPSYKLTCCKPTGDYIEFPVLDRKGLFVATRDNFVEVLLNGMPVEIHYPK